MAFVCLLSGTVSLLLQGLAGGFAGHLAASRQPVATGKSPDSVVPERLAHRREDPTADVFLLLSVITLLRTSKQIHLFFHFDTLAPTTLTSVPVCVLGAVMKSFRSTRWAFGDLPFLASFFLFLFKLLRCETFNLLHVCIFIIGYFTWNLEFDCHLDVE